MTGMLGEKIGEGAMADIHAWAPGRVLKLFRPGVPRGVGEHEARMTVAAFAAGAPAPQVFDEVVVEGRFGIVLPRLDGPTLQERLLSRAIGFEDAGVILAGLYHDIHLAPAPPEMLSLGDWFEGMLRFAGDLVPEAIVGAVRDRLRRMPPATGLCHGDLHVGNVIMTSEGPRVIDWAAAVRAGPGFDLGRCRVTLCELAPDSVDPRLTRALNAAVQTRYGQLAGLSDADLEAAIAPYMPILRALSLAERSTSPAQRAALIERIEAAL